MRGVTFQRGPGYITSNNVVALQGTTTRVEAQEIAPSNEKSLDSVTWWGSIPFSS